jgi:electron transport complex protein RnfG
MNPSSQNSAKDILKLGIVLGAIAFFIALMLGTVNSVTAPLIAENAAEQERQAFSALFPEATRFREAPYEATPPVASVDLAYKDNELLGAVVTAHPSGYGGEMELMVGFDRALCVTGIRFISIQETVGIGMRVTEESYLNQYLGLSEFSEVNAVTGASVSSKAVKSGVEAASQAASSTLEREGQ